MDRGTVGYIESHQNYTPRIKGRISGDDNRFGDWYRPKVGIELMRDEIMKKEKMYTWIPGTKQDKEIKEAIENFVEITKIMTAASSERQNVLRSCTKEKTKMKKILRKKTEVKVNHLDIPSETTH